MNSIKVLDVTLRDGGHRTGFHFKDDDLQQILSSLDKAGIDYIEVGYRNGILPRDANIGKSGLCTKDYLHYCRARIQNAKMAVMAYPANITPKDLLELKECGVDLLRLCVVRGGANEACALMQACEALALKVSINITHTSKYKKQELDKVVAEVSHYHPEMICFADSNGSLLPTKIKSIYKRYTKQYAIPFGFHAHDNLGLAQANAIAAINAGATYIDVSLSGLGRGIGNLRAEFFVAYLQALKNNAYHLEHLLSAVNYVRHTFCTENEALELSEFLRGISDT